MAKHSSTILEMARKGADHRFEELKAEIAGLVKSFPHLAGRKGGQVSPGSAIPAKALNQNPRVTNRRRRRSKMSATARKAVSARMKKYWAARRAAKAGAKK